MIVYEDRIVRAELVENAAAHGHLAIRAQRAVTTLEELSEEESAHLFQVASYAAAILFQGLQAQGTNIIMNEDEERLTVHVIARKEGDGLDFLWQPKQADEATLTDAYEQIKDAAFFIGKKKETPPPDSPEQPAPPESAEENYLVKHLIKNV
ncbi:HIT domain-containing protein [Candidatus Woesearchaeota archaeon]|nr:MAG: HIT domain-containing protein [Candidatus Woesearchaeota archaeon]